MLRVGLTGGLGSGKTTAAGLLAAHGAHILSSDEIARALMQPGQAVYGTIVKSFGPAVLLPDGRLDRPALARMAFQEGRLDELNAIVHPATIGHQDELAAQIETTHANAIVVIESALIFETRFGRANPGGTKSDGDLPWHRRFDKLILVTAPEELRVARFLNRSSACKPLSEDEHVAIEAEARRRMAQQIPDEQKAALCDYVLSNGGSAQELEWQVDRLWPLLLAASFSR